VPTRMHGAPFDLTELAFINRVKPSKMPYMKVCGAAQWAIHTRPSHDCQFEQHIAATIGLLPTQSGCNSGTELPRGGPTGPAGLASAGAACR